MIDFAESSVQEEIVRNYEAGRTTLCRPDFEGIRDFTVENDFDGRFIIENAGLLTDSGIFAMQNISRRFQEVLPNVLTGTYSQARYHFRHTGTPRTNSSIRAFATGLFGEAGAANVVYEPVPDTDWFMRPLDFCPAFREGASDSDRERNAFRVGPEMQALIQQVNDKLGFSAANRLSFEQIFYMWNWCQFKIATTFEESGSETGPDSPWCAPFSVEHHLIMEYMGDLGAFYLFGKATESSSSMPDCVGIFCLARN